MSLTDVVSGENGKAKLSGDFPGVTIGIVTDLNDPEKLGRIKVRITGRDALPYETDFIRMMTPMTGQQWGCFFLPEVGDEVLVSFVDGDVSRPYVLGALWNREYKPPVTMEGQNNDIRMIRTRSGHELIFNDADQKESIHIKTPQQLSIQLDDQKETIVVQDKDGKNMLMIDGKNGLIAVQANSKMTLQSGGSSITLDKQSLQIQSQKISLQAISELELSGTAMTTVNCAGMVTIKGAMVKIN